MHGIEKAMMRAVWESPEDDGPRLVMADWYDEQGSPRGEFIRLQCWLAKNLAAAKASKKGRAAYAAREKRMRELIDKQGKLDQFSNHVYDFGRMEWAWVRGFPEDLVVTMPIHGNYPYEAAAGHDWRLPEMVTQFAAQNLTVLYGLHDPRPSAADLMKLKMVRRLTLATYPDGNRRDSRSEQSARWREVPPNARWHGRAAYQSYGQRTEYASAAVNALAGLAKLTHLSVFDPMPASAYETIRQQLPGALVHCPYTAPTHGLLLNIPGSNADEPWTQVVPQDYGPLVPFVFIHCLIGRLAAPRFDVAITPMTTFHTVELHRRDMRLYETRPARPYTREQRKTQVVFFAGRCGECRHQFWTPPISIPGSWETVPRPQGLTAKLEYIDEVTPPGEAHAD